jgi:hypothetical protein
VVVVGVDEETCGTDSDSLLMEACFADNGGLDAVFPPSGSTGGTITGTYTSPAMCPSAPGKRRNQTQTMLANKQQTSRSRPGLISASPLPFALSFFEDACDRSLLDDADFCFTTAGLVFFFFCGETKPCAQTLTQFVRLLAGKLTTAASEAAAPDDSAAFRETSDTTSTELDCFFGTDGLPINSAMVCQSNNTDRSTSAATTGQQDPRPYLGLGGEFPFGKRRSIFRFPGEVCGRAKHLLIS